MTWSIQWHYLAERDLLGMRSWKTAARIDEAIQRFAETGEGALRRVETDEGIEYRLLVPPYFARISRDRTTRTIHVWRILRIPR